MMGLFAGFLAFVGVICTAIAIWAAMDRSTGRPLPRFNLRSLFVITTIIAGFSYAVCWCRNENYVDLYELNDVLAEHPEIDRVWIGAHRDLTLEVEDVYFSIAGNPNLTYYCLGPDHRSKQQFRKALERALHERKPVVLPLGWAVEYEFR